MKWSDRCQTLMGIVCSVCLGSQTHGKPGNLDSAALDSEPINRLPERSSDARDFERNKASPQQVIRPVSPE